MPDPVTTSPVDARLHADVLVDRLGKPDHFLPLDFERKITGIGVPLGRLFDERRGIPGLQVCADLTGA